MQLTPDSTSIFCRLRLAHEAGDYPLVFDLFNNFPVECWYGGRREELITILRGLPPGAERKSKFVQYATDFFSGNIAFNVGPDVTPTPYSPHRHPALSNWDAVIGSLLLRTGGYVHESLELLPNRNVGAGSAFFSVSETVRESLLRMLRGTALMLLCRFDAARKELIAIHAAQVPAELVFLRREALLKSALIEALYGDVRVARGHLRFSSEVPRTSSWMEPQLDAVQLLVTALSCEHEERSVLLRELSEVPLKLFGGVWPFAVIGLQRLYEHLGRHAEFTSKLELLEAAAPAVVEGNGVPGSVFHLSRAMSALTLGDTARAKEEMSTADQTLLFTRRLQAILDMQSGATEHALRYALLLRTETRNLRQLEIWRTALEVSALVAMNELDDAKLILTVLLKEMVGLNEEERRVFSAEVHEFAASAEIYWPERPEPGDILAIAPQLPSVILSSREREVLSQIVLGYSRSEAAQNLFVSENTVKTHLSSLYKKLGVVSRTQLIVEARLRSIV